MCWIKQVSFGGWVFPLLFVGMIGWIFLLLACSRDVLDSIDVAEPAEVVPMSSGLLQMPFLYHSRSRR